MAQRRMFSLKVVDTDAFLDMPLSSQALYFHLAMRADDDGFVSNPKKISRTIGTQDDDLKLLFGKRFVIPFESGVCVIKHWRIHNYIQKDRKEDTQWVEEMEKLVIDPQTKKYSLVKPSNENVSKMYPQVRLGKVNITSETKVSRVNNKTMKNTFGNYSESKSSDEYDDSIDLDTGEPINPKPKSRAKYPNAKEVFALFPNPQTQWVINTTQLTHAQMLYDEKGLEDVKEALAWYEKRKHLDYMPQIDTPYDLNTKWLKLERKVDELK